MRHNTISYPKYPKITENTQNDQKVPRNTQKYPKVPKSTQNYHLFIIKDRTHQQHPSNYLIRLNIQRMIKRHLVYLKIARYCCIVKEVVLQTKNTLSILKYPKVPKSTLNYLKLLKKSNISKILPTDQRIDRSTDTARCTVACTRLKTNEARGVIFET